MVEKTLDLKQVQRHEFFIKPSYSPDLTKLREELTKIENKVESQSEKVNLALFKGSTGNPNKKKKAFFSALGNQNKKIGNPNNKKYIRNIF
jgi:inhibitor of KinA sporulation pathway (predicted exonuclease)